MTLCLRKNLACVNSKKSPNLLVSPTSSPMALVFNNTQAWSYLILRKPTIQYVSVTSFTNLSHCICPIIPFSSLSPIWKVLPLLSTGMTLTPPQNLSPQSSSGCHTIDITFPLSFRHAASSTHPPRFIRRWHCPPVSVLAAWYNLPQNQSRCNDLTQMLHYTETSSTYPQNWNRTTFQESSPPPPPPPPSPSRTFFKSMTTLCPVPRQQVIYSWC